MRLLPLRPLLLLILAALLAPACETPPTGSDGAHRWAIAERAIYYGSREPITLSLSEGQKLAVGWLHWAGNPRGNFCTGTLVTPRVVATARHCLEGVGNASYVSFGVGLYPSQARDSFRATAMHLHPSVDAALLVLGEDATAAVPGIEPIPVNRAAPTGLRGDQVDAAGYGETHDGSSGRYFAAVWLEYVGGSYLQVDGRGEQGICFGDSGGPLLGPGPVLLAVESSGDQSCVGEDTMTRIDAILDWIDPILGGDAPPDPCDGLDYLGRCDGSVAEWCQNGQLRQYDCANEGKSCGYVDDEVGYYCTDGPAPDECGVVDYLGRCVGTVSEWCEDGQVRAEDCADRGMLCDWVDDNVGWHCVDPPADCGDVGPQGRCDDGVAVWCDAAGRQTRDCGAERLVCAWSGEADRYTCLPPEEDACPTVDSNGRCDDDVLVWCGGGVERSRDCAASGLACVARADGSHACEERAAACGPEDEGCEDGVAVRCEDGAIVTDPCAARGAACVHEPPAAPTCRVVVPSPPDDPDPNVDPDPNGDPDPGDPGPNVGPDPDDPDAAKDPSGGAPAVSGDEADENASSGCAAGGGPAPLPWPALLLLLVPLALRRRRPARR